MTELSREKQELQMNLALSLIQLQILIIDNILFSKHRKLVKDRQVKLICLFIKNVI